MYNVNIKTTDGQQVTRLTFPEDVKEVKLSQYIDFITAYNKFINWLGDVPEEELLERSYMLHYLKHVAHILAEFTGSKDVLNFPVGNFEEHLLSMFGAKDLEEIDFEQSTDTLLTIFANIRGLIVNYEPRLFKEEECTFEYAGETWTFPSVYKDALTSEINFQSISTGEAIEIMEVIRAWDNNRAKDEDGSIHYTSLLKLLAICCRKNGETFPTSDSGIEAFINERVQLFSGVDMQTALDVENWITGWWSALKKKNDFITSLIPPKNEGQAKKNLKR